MSTQNQAVVGDHSSIYMNTEEAVTRLAEDGINHNIEEAVSQRVPVHGQSARPQRTQELEQNLASTNQML